MELRKHSGLLARLVSGSLALGALGLVACERDEPEDTVEEAVDAVEDAADEAGDAIDDAADEIDDAVDDATDGNASSAGG